MKLSHKSYWFVGLSVIVLGSLLPYSLWAQGQTNFIHLDRAFRSRSLLEWDKKGNVLISDLDGIYKHDGYDFSLIPFTKMFGPAFKNKNEIVFKKDGSGNFWLATSNGHLSFFDLEGNTQKIDGPSDFKVRSITYDSASEVWLGGWNGSVYKYNHALTTLKRIFVLPLVNDQVQGITDMVFTNSGILWLGTEENRVYRYDTRNDSLQELDTPIRKDVFEIVFLTTDKKERLWISTEHSGLLRYSPDTKTFKQYDPALSKGDTARSSLFRTLFCDSKGIIWAGTDGDGLYRIDPETDRIEVFKYEAQNKFSLSSNTVCSVNEDVHGNIWVVVKEGKINILPNNKSSIEYYSGLPGNSPSRVLSTYVSSEGSIWIGSDGFGLSRIRPDGTRVHYGPNEKNGHLFKGRFIQRMVEDESKRLWIATYQQGLFTLNLTDGNISQINVNENNREMGLASDFRFLFKDSKKRIWATSFQGIHVFDHRQRIIAHFPYGQKGLKGSIGSHISETSKGKIWLSVMQGGLFEFLEDPTNLQNSTFAPVTYFPADQKNSYNYTISQIVPDSKGQLWLRCDSGFLVRLDMDSGNYFSMLDHPKLRNIEIRSMEVDDQNRLWLGSVSGIHRYDTNTGELESYYFTDGLQGNNFIRRSVYKADDGKLFFGGSNGVSAFYPEKMQETEVKANLYINQIEVLNKPAEKIIEDQVGMGIENVRSLNLAADQSSFSFRFSALGDVLRPTYVYAYRLRGFDEDWITPSNNLRNATYTNIPHGNYEFEVKAGTAPGVWDIAPKSIAITVAPYWWQSNVAYIAYVILALLIVTGIVLWYRLKNRLIREELQYTKEKELYASKMNFFAKMSHEIQTPLTLILGPISDMLKKADTKNNVLKSRLKLIRRNAERLSHIAADLTTIRNKELNKLKVLASKNNLVKDLTKIFQSFDEHAQLKQIDFVKEFPEGKINLWYDAVKLDHVFYNLLSNAFKLTPKGGQIIFRLEENKRMETVEVSVIDTGPGIPEAERKHVFELFYQAEDGKKVPGLGIGLALCKEIIDLHHGNLTIIPKEKGSHFKVSLSTREDVFEAVEKIEMRKEAISPEEVSVDFDRLESLYKQNRGERKTGEKKILVVEDNIEMQFFLQDLLSEHYTVFVANNGQEGFNAVEETAPDLIISDVMMPKMDGIDMAKKLAKKKSRSHIPIILLTAKNTVKSKLLGLGAGALSYMQKPFNPTELMLKVENLIKQQETIINRYKVESSTSPDHDEVKTKDYIFIENLTEKLNAEINKPDFKLEDLAGHLSMSYSVLFRKCQDITGKTPLEFYRTLRMKKAASLIIEYGYRVSDAAYEVGYSDTKYFTKCFKKEFGRSPAQLKREIDKSEWNEFMEKY